MSLLDVKQALFDTNLNFDSNMANEVFSFLCSFGVRLDRKNIHLQAIAGAAILSQIKLVPKIDNSGYVKYGINIEMIMSHLNGYSKQEFLQVLSQMTLKNQNSYNMLSSKIKNVQLCYRIFKKYRKSFQDLWTFTGIGTLIMNDMLSIFWVIYLLIKNKSDQIYGDLQLQIKLIAVLIKSIFQLWIAEVDTGKIHKVIQQNFNDHSVSQINEQFFILYHVEYLNEIKKLYSIRYQNQNLDIKKFSRNAIQIARYLDDITNFFYKEKQLFQVQNYIDEISFLQLKKILAPKPMKKLPKTTQKIQAIKKTLNFSNEDKQQNQNSSQQQLSDQLSKPLSNNSQYMIVQNLATMTPFRCQKDETGATPCSNRIANLQWVRNCIDLMSRQQSNELFRKIFSLTQKQSSEIYQAKARDKLLRLVQQFTPKCIKKEKRAEDIFSFFKYFIIKVFQNHNEKENTQMFKELKAFNAFLCLSSDMFNFAHSSLMSSYRKQCEYFEVSLIQALIPINWIGKNVQKPVQMNKYLYSLEKRIVIKEIWQNQTGYNLIKSQQNFNSTYSIGYSDMIIWKRLVNHIYDRIEELSKQVKLQNKLLKRIQNLIQLILKERPYLLHKNKIDQIIICCMTSFLSINQICQQQTLDKVFRDYSKIDLSFNQNKQGLSGDGKQMTLTQFYNQIFLPQIQSIVKDNLTDTDFLLTPIRRNHQQIFKRQGQIPTFSKQYKQNQINGSQQAIKSLNENTFFRPLFKIDNSLSPSNSKSDMLAMYRKKYTFFQFLGSSRKVYSLIKKMNKKTSKNIKTKIVWIHKEVLKIQKKWTRKQVIKTIENYWKAYEINSFEDSFKDQINNISSSLRNSNSKRKKQDKLRVYIYLKRLIE